MAEISNMSKQIEQSLMQYVGQILSAPEAVRQDAETALCRAMLQVAFKNGDEQEYDLYTCRPVFRAAAFIMKQQYDQLKIVSRDVEATREIQNLIKDYETTIHILATIAPPPEETKEEK